MIFPFASNAEVNINVGIFPPPPAFRISAPPPVFVIPGTYVYAVPDIAVEILFHQGYWYRPYEGRWYRSKSYNGPWLFLDPPRVPRVLSKLPPNYRRIPPGHQKIPYGQLKKNWGKWEREKYWEHDKRWRGDRRVGPGDRRDFGPDSRGKNQPPKPNQAFDKRKEPPNVKPNGGPGDRRDFGPDSKGKNQPPKPKQNFDKEKDPFGRGRK